MPETNDELLTRLVDYFEAFEQSTRDARKLSERDRDYSDHKQLTDSELQTLRKRKQPPTINNRIRKKINFLRGLERQGRTDPKAYPRTPEHDQDADAITDALRFVATNSNFDNERSKFFEDYVTSGTGACEVIVNKKNRDIELPHIAWDRFWYDEHSRELNFSDSNRMGIIIWSDLNDALAAFPDAEDILDTSFIGSNDDTYDDKPIKWVDSKRKRVRISQLYYMDKGDWWLAFYTKSGFLIDPVKSPWMDEEGEPESGIIAQSAYIDRKGNRYGEPRFMIEQQDSINKRESKMLHLVSQRQTFSNKKSGIDARKAKQELAKPDGHVELSGNAEFGKDFGVLPTGDMAAGQFTLLQEAKAEIDETSVNASLTGSDQGDSGRAILAKQSGGQVEITPLFDGKREFELRVYRSVWNRIKQFWTDERWIRVTDDEKNTKFVGLNRNVTVGELIGEQFGGIPPEFANDPRMMQVARVDNVVSEIDVDIIIEESPDMATIQIEQFEALAGLAQAGITFPPEVYIKASQLRDKNKLLEMLQGGDDPEQQAKIQQEQKIVQDAAVAKVDLDKSTAAKNNADAQATLVDMQTETVQQQDTGMAEAKLKAETDIAVANIKANSDEQIARNNNLADIEKDKISGEVTIRTQAAQPPPQVATNEPPEINITMPEINVNVDANGDKQIKINRDANGQIEGGTSINI